MILGTTSNGGVIYGALQAQSSSLTRCLHFSKSFPPNTQAGLSPPRRHPRSPSLAKVLPVEALLLLPLLCSEWQSRCAGHLWALSAQSMIFLSLRLPLLLHQLPIIASFA